MPDDRADERNEGDEPREEADEETELLVGDPVTGILDAAERWGADLIVVTGPPGAGKSTVAPLVAAATAMGYRPARRFLDIELPLAVPVLASV